MKKGFLASLTVCVSINCQAGDYFFEPKFSTSERYTDNLFMFQHPERDNWITTLSPSLSFGFRHENGELNSNFTWNQLFYTNESALNANEQLFGVNYQHITERLQWAFDGSYNNRASLNTVGTNTGLVFSQVMQKQLTISPSVTYSVSELSSVTLNYSYNKVNYEKSNINPFLADYEYHQASGTFNHLYTEQDKLNITLSSSRYSTPLQNQTTYNQVGQLGWQHSFSEKLVTFVSAGLNYSNAESTQHIPAQCAGFFFINNICLFPGRLVPASEITTKKSGFGQVYRAFIQKTFESGTVSLVASQNQTPTSQGLQTQTQIALNGNYAIDERWSSGLSASYAKYEQTGQQNSSLNRTYYSLSPNINWRWTPEINLGLSYTFRQQDFQGSNQSSQGNIVELQFSYQPQINHQVK